MSTMGTMGTMGMGTMGMSSGSQGSKGSKSMNTMNTMGSKSSMNTMGSKSSMNTMGSKSSMNTMNTMGKSSKKGMSSMGMGMGSMSGSMMMTGYLRFLMGQPQIHDLYMISLAIIGFFFLLIALSFSLYGSAVSIALCRAQKNNLNLGLIVKMVTITLLLTCIFAARCALIIWEDIAMRHDVNSEYLWVSYFLPEIIPATLILLLDCVQIFGEQKKAIAASMATFGFSKSKTATASTKSAMSATQPLTSQHSSTRSSASETKSSST